MNEAAHSAPGSTPDEPEAGPAGFVGRVVRVLDWIDRWVFVPLAVLALFALTIGVFADAVVRYTLDASIPFLGEFTGKLLMPMVVFLASSFVAAVRGNVAVDLLTQRFSADANRWLFVLFDLIGAVFLGLIAQQFFLRMVDAFGGRSATFEIPPSLTYAVIALGAGFATVRFLVSALAGITKTKPTTLVTTRSQDLEVGSGA